MTTEHSSKSEMAFRARTGPGRRPRNMSEPQKKSVRSVRSIGSSASQRLRPSGGYRDLRSFHVTTLIYDATVKFCDRFLDKR